MAERLPQGRQLLNTRLAQAGRRAARGQVRRDGGLIHAPAMGIRSGRGRDRTAVRLVAARAVSPLRQLRGSRAYTAAVTTISTFHSDLASVAAKVARRRSIAGT